LKEYKRARAFNIPGYGLDQPCYKPLCEPRAIPVRKLGGQVTTPTKTEMQEDAYEMAGSNQQ